MSKPFGYKGEEDTCLWCGDPLRKDRVMATDADKADPTYRQERAQFATVQAPVAGYEQNGYFDTLRCGFKFGLRIATLGDRLELNN